MKSLYLQIKSLFFVHKIFLFYFILSILILREISINNYLIGWDTTDSAFANFLYLVDSLKNFYLPMYNHFTLGGVSFWESLNTSNTSNFIDIILALVSQFVSPLYVFQFQYVLFAALSAKWIYNVLTENKFSSVNSFLGGFLYAFSIASFTIGQTSFFFPFVFFSYLLGCYKKFLLSPRYSYKIFATLLGLSLMMKSGPIFLIIFFSYAVIYYLLSNTCKLNEKKKLILGLFIMGVLYSLYILSSLVYLKNISGDLLGDFVSADPRLRSLMPLARYYYADFFSAFVDLYDGRFYQSGYWTYGINSLMLILNFIAFIQVINLRNKYWTDFFLFVVMFLFVALSAGIDPYKKIFESMPIINTHRWGFAFIYFAQLCSLLLSLRVLNRFSEKKDKFNLLIIAAIVFIFLLLKINYSFAAIVSALCAIILAINYLTIKKRMSEFTLLACLLISIIDSNSFLRPEKSSDPNFDLSKITNHELNQLQNRNMNIIINTNDREIGGLHSFYDYNNRNWFYNKKATMEGYNNSIHPIFWYLKGQSISNSFIIPICKPDFMNYENGRNKVMTDNEYIENRLDFILKTAENTKCNDLVIGDIKLTPNSIEFKTVSKYSLVLLNTNPFVWDNYNPIFYKRIIGGILFVENNIGDVVRLKFDQKNVFVIWFFLILGLIGFIFYIKELLVGRYFSKKGEI